MGSRDLSRVGGRPLVVRDAWPGGRVVPGRVVYEAHEYPWLWVRRARGALSSQPCCDNSGGRAPHTRRPPTVASPFPTHARQGNFDFGNYTAFSANVDRRWGYISKERIAPIWIGAARA